MGLHIAILEQLSTDRPAGIRKLHQDLVRATGDAHEAEHRIMECLAGALWRVQRDEKPFSVSIYYRSPVHRRDLAEQISRIVGQKTVNQTSYSYGEGRRSRQVSQTGQAILDTDEIAHLREDETIVLIEGCAR